MQSLGIFGGLSIMSKIIRQADGVHLGLPSSKENISSTGKMIKTELSMYHWFWIWVPSFCLPGWSRMTRRSTMAHGTYHMDQIKPCNTSTAALGHTTGLGCPSSFNAESRKKKLMKEIFREAIRVSLPGSAVEMWWGAKPPHRHQSPAERCLSLQSHIDLHWESATASQILFSFVLATWSEFTWATSLWPKSALKHCFEEQKIALGLACPHAAGWDFRSHFENQKTFKKIISRGLLLFCEEGISGYKRWK